MAEERSSPSRSLRQLHDRLGAMIDQIGQPDYSLRQLVNGLREIRDGMLVASESERADGWCPDCKGSGTVKGMTHGHGPDDYEIDVECPKCRGTGAGEAPEQQENDKSLSQLHDRLGAMIDQIGHPDYSLRELVKGLREIRDGLLVCSAIVQPSAAQWIVGRIAWLKEEMRMGGDHEHLNTRRKEAITIAEKLGIQWNADSSEGRTA